jgi:hypothetical protein
MTVRASSPAFEESGERPGNGLAARVENHEGELAELRGMVIRLDSKLEVHARAERRRRAPHMAAVASSGLIFDKAIEALRDPLNSAHAQTMVICLLILVAMLYTHRSGANA